ncbi:MAG: hypothetical protein ACE5KC_00635 [Candidatus Bathyarchaeia archaeon]
MEIEYKKIEEKTNRNVKFDHEKGEIRLFGTRIALTNLLPACEKVDKMFGTGGEVIINCMAFEQGRQLFEAMMTNSPNKSKEELLKEVADVQPQAGLGIASLEILSDNPPKIEVVVKNSPVKTLRGSAKQWIGAFWAGVLSKYFSQQLKCTSFSYDEEEDKLRCVITA